MSVSHSLPSSPRLSADAADEGDSIGSGETWRIAARVASIGIFLLLFIAFLDLARNFLLPVVSAVVIGTVLDPLVRRAERAHIPPPVVSVAVVGLLLLATYLGLMVLSAQITQVIDALPRLIPAIRDKLQGLDGGVAILRGLQQSVLGDGADARPQIDLAEIVKPVLSFLTPAIGELLVFFTTLFLFLIDRTTLRRKLILVFSGQQARLRAIHLLNEIQRSLTRYVGAVTVINLGVGMAAAAMLYAFGYPNPVFWGVVAFILNYIPYLGPGMMIAGIFVAGLTILPTFNHAVAAAALFLGITAVEGHFITPAVIGYNFRTGALVTFLSLAFWTWLWGPVGTFLAIPVLLVVTIVLSNLFPGPEVELPD